MLLEIGQSYKTTHGQLWKIIEQCGGQPTQFAGMMVGARWDGKRHLTRHFHQDGRYFKHRSDKWDLVEHVPDPKTPVVQSPAAFDAAYVEAVRKVVEILRPFQLPVDEDVSSTRDQHVRSIVKAALRELDVYDAGFCSLCLG